MWKIKKSVIKPFIFVFIFVIFGCTTSKPLQSRADIQRELEAVRLSLEIATEQLRQLTGNNKRAIEIIQRSEQRYKEFENDFQQYAEFSTDVLDRIEYRNQRIEKLTTELWGDYQELRKAIRNSS